MKLVKPIVVDELPHSCRCCEFNQNKYCSALMLMQGDNSKIGTFVNNNDDCRSPYCPLSTNCDKNFFSTFDINRFEKYVSDYIEVFIDSTGVSPNRIECNRNTIDAWCLQSKLAYGMYNKELLNADRNNPDYIIMFHGIQIYENNNLDNGRVLCVCEEEDKKWLIISYVTKA